MCKDVTLPSGFGSQKQRRAATATCCETWDWCSAGLAASFVRYPGGRAVGCRAAFPNRSFKEWRKAPQSTSVSSALGNFY
jgi:hypothetical protein